MMKIERKWTPNGTRKPSKIEKKRFKKTSEKNAKLERQLQKSARRKNLPILPKRLPKRKLPKRKKIKRKKNIDLVFCEERCSAKVRCSAR